MNLDFFKFFFKSFKYFYPSTLQSIYLMDTQLKLQPSWKIIKSWLDPSLLSVTHSVTSTSIRNYVAEEFVPRSLGGYDDFEFKMADLSRCISNTNSQTDSGYYENADQIPNLDMTMMRKTVSFGEEDECVARVSPLTMSAADGNKMITSVNGSLVGNSESERLSRKNSKGNLPPSVPPRSGSIKRNGHIPIHLRGLVEQKLNAPADDWFQNDFVAMIPSNEITLKSVESENDSVDIVILRNVSNETVFYKIKITSPEKFRVRPSTGILKPGAKEVIRLYLQNEYKNNISKDKFLLMAMAVEENASFDNFSKIWSQKSDDKKIERKIKCTVEDGSADRNIVSSMKKHSLSSSPVNSIYESNELKSIIKTQNIILLLLAVICIIQVVMLVKVFGSSDLSINNHDLCPKAVSNDLPLADQLTSSLPFQNDEL
uniref:Major sperm protein n=1 Tax=Rhabditophanes sp. KR3021 TaxID=114890 RepID=A0AC35THL0_9BILA